MNNPFYVFWIELNWVELSWTELNRIELNWIESPMYVKNPLCGVHQLTENMVTYEII